MFCYIFCIVFGCVQACINCCVVECQFCQVRQGIFNGMQFMVELSYIVGKFLFYCDWCSIYKVSMADFYDVYEFF